jgi:hypothetical protein
MPLSDLTNIGYSTYRKSPVTDANQIAAINLLIDYNGATTDGFDTLVFEPVYQPGGVSAINNDKWQNWDAGGDAIWWSTHDINGTCASTCYSSLANIKANNPDAIVLGYIINQGSGNPSLTTGVDAFTFNDTTYDFELAPPAQVAGMDIKQGATEIGCGGYVSTRTITVSWDAVPGADHYKYQADADQTLPYDFTTNVSGTSRTGDIRDLDGTYSYRVAAVDAFGTQGDWSNWCTVTLDRVA